MNLPEPRMVAGLAVREWGEPTARPVFFWHALGDHNNLQLIEAGPILARDFGLRLIAPDGPGFGGSPRVDDDGYAVPALVAHAERLLDELGLDSVAWMGSSWGASLGVHFAAAHPDRLAALVLLDGGYSDAAPGQDQRTLAEEQEHWRGQPELFGYDDWDAMVSDARQYFRRWSPELEAMNRGSYREEGGRVVSRMGPDVYGAAIYGIRTSPPSAVHERLGQSGIPVLLLAATLPEEQETERAAARERFASLVPQADVRVLPDTPHFVLEDKPVETAKAVGDWLRAVTYA